MKKKALLLTIGIVLSMTTTAFATNFGRLGGLDRYETASLINNEMKSETLILVSGNDFADALSASGLIKYYNAEIHLSNRGELDSNTISSLNNKEFKRAIIVGGTTAVSASIEDQLKTELGKENVERLGGPDRYETSAIVASKTIASNSHNYTSYSFIATGKDFADALSVAPIAASHGYPIILTPGDSISESAINVLKNVGACYKIGGETVVSDKIDSLIGKESFYIERLGGLDRYETNKAVIGRFNSYASDYNNVYVANGLKFPDALTGSALAAKNRAPIVFVDNKTVNQSTQDVIDCFQSKNLIALGGTDVVSDKTMKELLNTKADQEPIFKYESKVVLPLDKRSSRLTAQDIGLVATGKKGNDCSWTFSVHKNSYDESGSRCEYQFSVVIDGENKCGRVAVEFQ